MQDILKPFPAEHLGRYDLVHVRLVIAALKEGDYSIAVENLQSLLSKVPLISLHFLLSLFRLVYLQVVFSWGSREKE